MNFKLKRSEIHPSSAARQLDAFGKTLLRFLNPNPHWT